MDQIPSSVTAVFMLTAFFTVGIFLFGVRPAAQTSLFGRAILFAVPFWMIFQYLLARLGFFENTAVFPPRLFLFGVAPALLLIGLAFLVARDSFVDPLSIKVLTIVHIVRIPVELTLAWLAEAHVVPEIMTFRGTNFDILSGLTSPIALYLAYRNDRVGRLGLLVWNLAALVLVLNIVITAILCVPSPIQRLAFDQPNIAVLHAPFIWLPTVIVPIVFFSHFASLYKLLTRARI